MLKVVPTGSLMKLIQAHVIVSHCLRTVDLSNRLRLVIKLLLLSCLDNNVSMIKLMV